ncbi:MAG: PIG-L family deacetylase [Fibrobacterota bacterium]|nr:PIG-L family deacetylase [Fibrobacterota bacterium]
MKKFLPALLLCASALPAAPVPALSSAEIHLALRKLNVLGSVLYLAAHPDDENNRLMAYLSKEKLYRTGYLSLNRGEGGQNLIGPEQGALLGLIRTQELLKARAVDGAEQFFTRAIDFGYSKTTTESLEKWGKDSVLADVVWILRTFRPNLIITRFTPTVGGHGHHTASAELAKDALLAAADSTRFPAQLKFTTPWKARSVYWNAWRPEEKPGSPTLPMVDVGAFNPLLGQSYNEIAALSRNNHKSQGFGTKPLRGSEPDRFQYLSGDSVASDLFEKVDKGWAQVKGGEAVSALVERALQRFDFTNPGKVMPQVLQIHAKLSGLPDGYWVRVKKAETEALIRALLGLWVETTVEMPSAAAGSSVPVKLKVVVRSMPGWTLENISFPFRPDTAMKLELRKNMPESLQTMVAIPTGHKPSQPYWLEKTPGPDLYQVEDQARIGKPDQEPALRVGLRLRHKQHTLSIQAPVEHAYLDKVRGEIFQPFIITPEATVGFGEQVYLFPRNDARDISVTVKNHRDAKDGVIGQVRLRLPSGWTSEPALRPFNLKGMLAEEKVSFRVRPPAGDFKGKVGAELVMQGYGGALLDRGFLQVEYPHIPTQTLFPAAEADLIKGDIRIGKEKVGYIMGAGDMIPGHLRELGYAVTLLDEGSLNGDLRRFDAIITGVRAFNTRKDLTLLRGKLMDFVHAGGRLIVQYNVNTGLVTEDMGPYPFKLSRDRITVEEAPLRILDKDNPFLNAPNKIIPEDFAGWVQERGLYFAEQMDAKYIPLLEGSDPGEKPSQGMLIYATYGKGSFLYTGLSLFRQLPAGVAGGYKLFANLISAPLKTEAAPTRANGKGK